MDFFNALASYFMEGLSSLGWQQIVMFAIGGILIYLAVAKDYEPALLLPIGFGAILVNLPLEVVWSHDGQSGALQILYNAGIMTELFPLLIFIGVGAMIDFRPLLQRPWMLIFGIVAYSYMSLVPIIMPPVIKLLTTKKERLLRVESKDYNIPKWIVIVFPIFVALVCGILVPVSAPLMGFLMFGNLIRECGVIEKLSKSAQNELANIVTLLLGISVGGTMRAENFLQPATLIIMLLGLIAFVGDTMCGVLFAKFLNLFRKNKLNPMLGACGLSAFPMASRVVQKMALKEDDQNFILMHAVSANVSGQIGSVLIGGIIIAILESHALG